MARVLLIQHTTTAHAGLVGDWLARQQHEVTVCRAVLSEPLPEPQAFDGIVVFGGPQCANDACPLLTQELHWIEKALTHDQRVIGICLGAQLMAKALGAQVSTNPDGRVECGYTWVDPGCANPWIQIPRSVYHWHHDSFTLPDGGKLLARGRGAFPVQGFSWKHSLGFQFHPEATSAIMERWLARDQEDLTRPGACSAVEHRRGYDQYGPTNAAWLDRTMARWLTAP